MSAENSSNILKRKNEDTETCIDDQINKRVALDSEQLDLKHKKEDQLQTAPPINVNGNVDHELNYNPEEKSSEATETTKDANTTLTEQNIPAELYRHEPLLDGKDNENVSVPSLTQEQFQVQPQYQPPEPQLQPQLQYQTQYPSKPVSNHRERDNDPTYVLLRMYCPVKEASAIVGKRGDKINHIREKANVRINVSDNLKDIPERIVTVRGSAENVARAFGLIARTILEEPEDEPASMLSKQYNLKILMPHPMVGYIIGKGGTKFREIEENSAAKLKAAEQALPYSTDRVLAVTGVGDAIHIAIYYISQVILEHKDCLKKNKIVYYNPANYHHSNVNAKMMNIGVIPQGNPNIMGGMAPQHMNPMHQHGMRDNGPMQYNQQPKQPYNFQMMFQPTMHPQQHYVPPQSQPMPMNIPPQNPYTDEHGNNIIGDVITHNPVPLQGPNPDKFNQDIFVANANIGSVIGKGGNNIKHIRENSGCTYVRIEPDRGQSIMLGGGKGLTNIRKLTLTGSLQAIQTAIYLINQRIVVDKERNAH
jgi:poly(rC)-binding protein 2/3/4